MRIGALASVLFLSPIHGVSPGPVTNHSRIERGAPVLAGSAVGVVHKLATAFERIAIR